MHDGRTVMYPNRTGNGLALTSTNTGPWPNPDVAPRLIMRAIVARPTGIRVPAIGGTHDG